MGESEGFLSRWSRRRHTDVSEIEAALKEAIAASAARGALLADPAVPPPPDPLAVNPAALPPIESVTANSDIRAFLAPGVPAELTQEALRRAQEKGLDLVEVNPKAEPPVCKILDFGKYKYEEKKKQAQARRNQAVVEIKEVKLRPKTDDHDIDFKVKASRRFLEGGHKVKFTVRFRGREITHPEKAHEQLDIILKQLEDIANVETRPMMEARAMSVITK